MHPSNFQPCGVRPYVRPPLHVNRVEILHFKYTRISAVNRSIATRTFRDKNNNNNEADSQSFDLILKSTLAWITEKELEPEIKRQRRPISFEE